MLEIYKSIFLKLFKIFIKRTDVITFDGCFKMFVHLIINMNTIK